MQATTSTLNESDATPGPAWARPRWPVIASVMFSFAAAWIAAGSAGLLGYPLQRTLVWGFVVLAVACDLPRRGPSPLRLLAMLPVAGLAVWMFSSPLAPVRVMSVALIPLALRIGRDDKIQLAAAQAIVVFALYRLAMGSVPTVWLVMNRLGEWLAAGPSKLIGKPVWAGATFAGIDFLVLTGAFAALRPRERSSAADIAKVVGIVAFAHLVYLVLLAIGPGLHREGGDPMPWAWDLPFVAGGLHMIVVAYLARSSRQIPATTTPSRATIALTLVTAALLPAVATLPTGRSSLEGKKVVAFEKCFGNWMKPKYVEKPKYGDYGRLAIGMYGMLQPFVESLGGRFLLSKDLSAGDLSDADVLILAFPHEKWEDGQLARIRGFMERGGGVLLLGEHTTASGERRFNDVLERTAMKVRFDAAEFAIGGWLQSYEALAHPTSAGVGDERNEFGVVIGASLECKWPARPLLVGRWGWNDVGDEAHTNKALLGNGAYDSGEKLGDIVLAAEQRIGKGTLVAFGDTSSMTNGITIGSHGYTSRLLAYLGTRPGTPQDGWRQMLTLVALVGFGFLLLRRAKPMLLSASILVFAASLAASTAISHELGKVLPDGRGKKPNNLAYVDATHFGRFSNEAWRLDGTMGIKMGLMRSGFLTFELRKYTRERLERAGFVISIGPAKKFTPEECRITRDFVAGGGIFVLTASYPDREGSKPLLDTFGFEVGRIDSMPDCEPQPLGHYKTGYMRGPDYMSFVRLYEAWPVSCIAADAPPVEWTDMKRFDERTVRRLAGWLLGNSIAPAFPWMQRTHPARVLAYSRERNDPVILMRRYGKGAFVVAADTCFALNKNLEIESGQAFEGMRENPFFWRWLLTVLRGQPMWTPPKPAKEKR